MGLLSWILLGLAAGAIGKAILPGKAEVGWFGTMLLGIGGAIVGGWVGSIVFHTGLGSFFSLRTWVLSVIGALIVISLYGWLKTKD